MGGGQEGGGERGEKPGYCVRIVFNMDLFNVEVVNMVDFIYV